MASALALGARGPGFESLLPDFLHLSQSQRFITIVVDKLILQVLLGDFLFWYGLVLVSMDSYLNRHKIDTRMTSDRPGVVRIPAWFGGRDGLPTVGFSVSNCRISCDGILFKVHYKNYEIRRNNR